MHYLDSKVLECTDISEDPGASAITYGGGGSKFLCTAVT